MKSGDAARFSHRIRGNEPLDWFNAAARLLKTSAIAWEGSDSANGVIWPCLMLRGYAVENLFKAIAVHEGHRFSDGDRFLKFGKALDHDLLAMARELSIDAPATKTDLRARDAMLRHLTQAALWMGRYPIPKRPRDIPVDSPWKRDTRALWSSSHENELWSLLDRLEMRMPFCAAAGRDVYWQLLNEWRPTTPAERLLGGKAGLRPRPRRV